MANKVVSAVALILIRLRSPHVLEPLGLGPMLQAQVAKQASPFPHPYSTPNTPSPLSATAWSPLPLHVMGHMGQGRR